MDEMKCPTRGKTRVTHTNTQTARDVGALAEFQDGGAGALTGSTAEAVASVSVTRVRARNLRRGGSRKD